MSDTLCDEEEVTDDGQWWNENDPNSPDTIWDTLIAPNKQIFMVESGHNDGQYHQVTDDNAGLPVLEEMNDFQDWNDGGDGYMMLFTFDTTANTVHVQTYSPITNDYITTCLPSTGSSNSPWLATANSNGCNYTESLDLHNYVVGPPTPGGAYPSTSFQNGTAGYNGEVDTYIAGDNPWYYPGSSEDNDNMWGQAIDVDQYEVAKGLIQFNNMFGNGAGQIPYGSIIEHVTLGMYNSGSNDDAGGDAANINALYQSWNPATVTWSNFDSGNPPMNSTVDGTIGVDNNSLEASPFSTANDGNLINTLQSWSNGAANDGWILQQEGRSGFYGDDGGLWLAGCNSATDTNQQPELLVDYAPPPTITSFTTSATLETDGKYHVDQGSQLVVSLGASDAWAGDDITYSVDGASVATAGSGTEQTILTFNDPGTYTISGSIVDSNGFELNAPSQTIVVDNVAPTVQPANLSISDKEGQPVTNNGVFLDPGLNDLVSVTASVGKITQDSGNQGGWTWYYTPTNTSQSQTVVLTATDNHGAVSTTTFNLLVNNVPPALSVQTSSVEVGKGTAAVNHGLWSDVGGNNVVLSASLGTVTENAGGSWDWSFTPSSPSQSQTVTITANDGASNNNLSSVTFSLLVDNTPPTVSRDVPTVTVNPGQAATNTGEFASASGEAVSLTASVGTVTQNNGNQTWSWSYTPTDGSQGSQTVTVTATDTDGAVSTTSFNLVVAGLVSTGTAVTSSDNSSTYGQTVTFTATVTPASGGGETGTVQFQIDGSNVGSPVAVNNGTASYSTATLTAGSHSVVAIYSGDGNFSGSTSPTFNQLVSTATPTIAWNTPAAITYGTALGSTQLDASASVAGTYSYGDAAGTVLHAGLQTLSVTFTPTDTTDYNSVTDSVNLAVNKALLTVAADNKTRAYGAADPAWTYSVSGFVNGDTSSAVSGVPSLSTTATAASVPGVYPIDIAANTLAANDYTFNLVAGGLTISQASTTTVATSNGSSSYGQTVTFTATVTPASGGGETGTVQFQIDGSDVGAPVAVSNGTASYSTSTLTAGSHSVVAIYNGDDNFAGSTSPVLTQVIQNTVLSWASAAIHGEGVGEALLTIPNDGSFSEPCASGIQTLVITFAGAIDPSTFTPASVMMAGNDANSEPIDLAGITITTSTSDGNTVGTIQFSPALPDYARYLVEIAGVTDTSGNPVVGGTSRLMTALKGDVSGDGVVNAIDLARVRGAESAPISPTNISEVRADVSGDGQVNAIDLARVRACEGEDARGIAYPVLSDLSESTPAPIESSLLAAVASPSVSSPSTTSAQTGDVVVANTTPQATIQPAIGPIASITPSTAPTTVSDVAAAIPAVSGGTSAAQAATVFASPLPAATNQRPAAANHTATVPASKPAKSAASVTTTTALVFPANTDTTAKTNAATAATVSTPALSATAQTPAATKKSAIAPASKPVASVVSVFTTASVVFTASTHVTATTSKAEAVTVSPSVLLAAVVRTLPATSKTAVVPLAKSVPTASASPLKTAARVTAAVEDLLLGEPAEQPTAVPLLEQPAATTEAQQTLANNAPQERATDEILGDALALITSKASVKSSTRATVAPALGVDDNVLNLLAKARARASLRRRRG